MSYSFSEVKVYLITTTSFPIKLKRKYYVIFICLSDQGLLLKTESENKITMHSDSATEFCNLKGTVFPCACKYPIPLQNVFSTLSRSG